MAGFANDTVYGNNADFSIAASNKGQLTNGLITNGQLWIGSTALNVGGTHINVGILTSPDASVAIGYSTPNITLQAGATTATTYTTDSGNAVPALNILNVLGRSGSKTGGTGNTVTVRSPPYADAAGSASVTLNSGSFATAAVTLTTPVSAGLLDGDVVEFVATNGILVIQLAATQVAHIGNLATSVAGSFTSTATGDSVKFRYQVSTNDWWAMESQGNWVPA
jgi:hypothetical protein